MTLMAGDSFILSQSPTLKSLRFNQASQDTQAFSISWVEIRIRFGIRIWGGVWVDIRICARIGIGVWVNLGFRVGMELLCYSWCWSRGWGWD